MSEEFGGALPSVIVEEIRRVPADFLDQILEYRAYGRAKALYEANPTASGGLVELVREIRFEMAQEAMRR